MSERDQHRLSIGIAKTVAWEDAKAKLRAVSALSGSYPSDHGQRARFCLIEKTVENFISEFEDRGYHEP